MKKLAITSLPINSVIAERWSCRAYDVNKKVTREQIISICEAGRWAPSCNGDEPWRFIVWDKFHNKELFDKAYNCVGEWNQRWVKNVPVLLVACADTKFRRNGEPNYWRQFDTGAASMNIYLQAVTLGLMAHPFAGFDRDKIRMEFNIPEQFDIMAMIAIGYQAEADVLDDEKQRANELKERERKPIGTEFFDSEWENAIMQF
ncbi:MAG: nitroreductase family protein [Bacteroidetes bacterium]|nr:nitroreductase family protein [Bacteroidota bacterium]